MRILISGASGFLGSHVVPFLQERGHAVIQLTRSPSQPEDVEWHPAQGKIEAAKLPHLDAVLHLAGENIANGLWTEAKRQRIRDSRVQSTQLLSETLASLSPCPTVFLTASAVGYYGNRGDQLLTEESESGEGFLADVCRQWEAATLPAAQAGIRTIFLRNGLVLAAKEGALGRIILPFKLGLGGQIGDGQQYWSWISITDWLYAVLHCLTTETLSGPVNTTAPQPVRNREFTKTLGRILNRPTLVPVPKFAIRLILGQMADEMLLASARVIPSRLQASGYTFFHPTLHEALQSLL